MPAGVARAPSVSSPRGAKTGDVRAGRLLCKARTLPSGLAGGMAAVHLGWRKQKGGQACGAGQGLRACGVHAVTSCLPALLPASEHSGAHARGLAITPTDAQVYAGNHPALRPVAAPAGSAVTRASQAWRAHLAFANCASSAADAFKPVSCYTGRCGLCLRRAAKPLRERATEERQAREAGGQRDGARECVNNSLSPAHGICALGGRLCWRGGGSPASSEGLTPARSCWLKYEFAHKYSIGMKLKLSTKRIRLMLCAPVVHDEVYLACLAFAGRGGINRYCRHPVTALYRVLA